jgi:hypothetical protein
MQTKKNIREQYGVDLKNHEYRVSSNKLLWLCFFVIFVIPMELFFERILAREEDKLIAPMQHFILSQASAQLILQIAEKIIWTSEVLTVRYVVYFLYLAGDAILATKVGLVAFFGEFLVVILKMANKEPRPYWQEP